MSSPATGKRSNARRLASAWNKTKRSIVVGGALLLSIAALVTLRIGVAEASTTHRVAESVNAARGAHGLPEVTLSRALQRSATAYSKWMLRSDYFGHVGSIRAPRRFRRRGEVLAATPLRHPSARQIVSQWLNSRFHRAVVLNRRYRFIGVGVARGRLGARPTTVLTGHFAG